MTMKRLKMGTKKKKDCEGRKEQQNSFNRLMTHSGIGMAEMAKNGANKKGKD